MTSASFSLGRLLLRDSSDDEPFESPYGYIPTQWICIMFVTLFSITSLIHFIHAIWKRQWFVLPTMTLSGVAEILGWSARLWSSKNIFADNAFTIQIAVLIIAPTPLLGAHFIIFGRLVEILGAQYSRFRPRLYARIFLSCDIGSLVLQAIGGGMASSAANQVDGDLAPGTNLMLAGIAVQLGIIIFFGALAFEFVYRYNADKPVRVESGDVRGVMDTRRRAGLYAVLFATSCLLVRAIFRLVELGGGWDGKVIHTQWSFDLFDSGMVVLALFTWNFVPSSWILAAPSKKSVRDFEMHSNASDAPLSPATAEREGHGGPRGFY